MNVRMSHVRLADLQRRLQVFEERYGLPSERLLEAFTVNGRLQETEDLHAWQHLYAVVNAVRRTDARRADR